MNPMNPIANITFSPFSQELQKHQDEVSQSIIAIWCLTIFLPKRLFYQMMVLYIGLYLYRQNHYMQNNLHLIHAAIQ